MRKLLLLAIVIAAAPLVGCRSETPGEKVERGLRNLGDDIEDAVD